MSEVAPMFSTRPDPPAAGSEQEDRWAKDATIAFEGGYIKSAYGNLIQTWNLASVLSTCASTDVERAGYTASRTNTIGGSSKSVTVSASTYKKYNRRNGSLAAGGDAYTFVTDVGTYTARCSGDVQTVIKWICDNKDKQYGTLEVFTGRGAAYGPFGIGDT